MKRLLLFLLLASSVRAQLTPAPNSTGSITTNSSSCNTTNACVVLHMAAGSVGYSVGISGTWTGTLTVEQSADNQTSWASATTTTNNTTFSSALSPGLTDVRVRGSAAMTGSAVVTITAGGPATVNQTISNVFGGGGAFTTAGSGIDVTAAPYSIKADGVFVLDATTTSGSGTLTVPDGAAFLNTVQAGMTIFGVSGAVANCPSRTTVLSVNVAAGTISVSPSTVTANNTATCYLSWGTDQTAAILSAATALKALPHCGILQFPSGGILLQSGFMNGTPSTCQQGGAGVGEGPDVTIAGRGIGVTQFMLTPDFSWASCIGSDSTCIGGSGVNLRDFSINGSNLAFTGIATGGSFIHIGGGSNASSIGLYSGATGVAGSSGNLDAMFISSNGGRITAFVDSFGITGMEFGVLNVLCEDCFSGNVAKPVVIDPCNASVISINSTWGPTGSTNAAVVNNQCTYIAYGDFFNASAVSSIGVEMSAVAAKAFLNQTTINNTTVATSTGIFWNATGAVVEAIGSTISGGATNGALFDTGHPGVYQDMSGNTLTNFVAANFTGSYLTSSNTVGVTLQKAETGTADANVLTFTPPALAGSYRACVAASVSSATAGVIAWTLSWTDSNGNAQSNIAQDLFQDGTAAPATTFTTSAAGNYHFCREVDVNNAAAAIIVKWVGGGTTAAKVSAVVERLR